MCLAYNIIVGIVKSIVQTKNALTALSTAQTISNCRTPPQLHVQIYMFNQDYVLE